MVKTLSIVVALAFVAFLAWFVFGNSMTTKPVSETIPAITYTNASDELIVVEAPTPGEAVAKEFDVSGTARGNWFFEASFPIEVQSPSGETLWIGPATAEGEWMTTEFVPFSATISVASAYQGAAMLILRKDNPSGLPEYDASVEFPIHIE